MPYLVRVGRIDQNASGVGSRGYAIFRTGRKVIVWFGKIEAVGRRTTRFYWCGDGGIPPEWLTRITRSEYIVRLARRLFECAFPWRGSRKHVLDLVSSRDFGSTARALLHDYSVSIADDTQRYPSGYSASEELDLREFCRRCTFEGCDLSPLNTWWAPSDFKGPTWDLLAQCSVGGRPGVLLVEAKARVGELDRKGKSPGSASAQGRINDAVIQTAIHRADTWFRKFVSPDCDLSASRHYQLVNRLAAAQVLATCGLQVILVFLGFTGDKYFSDFLRDEKHWDETMRDYTAGVLPRHAIGPTFSDPTSRGSVRVVVATTPVRERSVVIA